MDYFNKQMYEYGSKTSTIMDLFEFGRQREAECGKGSVFDFSIGNPNTPPPECVKRSLIRLLESGDSVTVHGYTSQAGNASLRQAVANNLTRRFCKRIDADLVYICCGASSGLCVTLNALACEGDEAVICSPYFSEYPVYLEAAGYKVKTAGYDDKFQIDLDSLRSALSPRTKAVIVNSPNNPSGAVYTEKTLKGLAAILDEHSRLIGRPVYLLSDEPYREFVYNCAEAPFVASYYKNTIILYSFSKSLSLPGERIGYIAINPEAYSAKRLYAAIDGSARALGYVCAPSLFQLAVAECIDAMPDLAPYVKNRSVLLDGLTSLGYECVPPDGAFYIFVKSLIPDDYKFSEEARNFGLLLVPGSDFGAKGYVRLAYCVAPQTAINSLPAFAKLKQYFDNMQN